MPLVFQIKTIRPKKVAVDAIRLELLNEIRRQGKKIKKQYERTTATWRRKPKFEIIIGLSRKTGEASVLVGTDDKIYRYIDEGTRVRRAIMSKDWISKTTPRIIGSNPGRGRVVFISKKVERPGIKAREFSSIIQKRLRKPYHREMIKAVNRGIEKAKSRR